MSDLPRLSLKYSVVTISVVLCPRATQPRSSGFLVAAFVTNIALAFDGCPSLFSI